MPASIDASDGVRMARDARSMGRQLAFANVVAMTRSAAEARTAVQEEMRSVFDRPTAFTLGAIYLKPATKAEPEARIGIKDGAGVAGRVVPPAKYLAAEIEGGSRRQKGFEKRLQAMGAMPRGWFAVPTRFARLDDAGNITSAQIRQILSQLSAATLVGPQRANAGALRKGLITKSGGVFFAVPSGQKGLRAGIYQRRDSALGSSTPRPILLFVPSVNYRRRLDFFGVAQAAVDTFFPAKLDEAIGQYVGKAA